ncbi:MAG: polysaccharide deacetylase family protein, partial [Clostridia bacterium]|nr:polysaccharide deacetylase family protein [Clostridia bacterium]MBR0278099.1 polysaccharide deacetylase family protein [Clostridia bacterium]
MSEVLPVFNQGNGIKLPVLMYHSVTDDASKTGKYVITKTQFEEDIKYLKKKGYNTVSAKQLIKYVYLGEDLPENPIVLSFDDGMYNNKEYVLPILEKYDYCAVFSIVGSYADEYTENNIVNPDYSYLRWQDIVELSDNPRIEFGNHSYAFHSISRE